MKKPFPVERVKAALLAIADKLTEPQKQMLRTHYLYRVAPGCALSQILMASHIVPWKDATNAERLDPFNGLLLTPNLDKLFDQFRIAFNDDGSILLSKDLTAEEWALLGVSEKSKLRFVRPAMLPYLQRHRELYRAQG